MVSKIARTNILKEVGMMTDTNWFLANHELDGHAIAAHMWHGHKRLKDRASVEKASYFSAFMEAYDMAKIISLIQECLTCEKNIEDFLKWAALPYDEKDYMKTFILACPHPIGKCVAKHGNWEILYDCSIMSVTLRRNRVNRYLHFGVETAFPRPNFKEIEVIKRDIDKYKEGKARKKERQKSSKYNTMLYLSK